MAGLQWRAWGPDGCCCPCVDASGCVSSIPLQAELTIPDDWTQELCARCDSVGDVYALDRQGPVPSYSYTELEVCTTGNADLGEPVDVWDFWITAAIACDSETGKCVVIVIILFTTQSSDPVTAKQSWAYRYMDAPKGASSWTVPFWLPSGSGRLNPLWPHFPPQYFSPCTIGDYASSVLLELS